MRWNKKPATKAVSALMISVAGAQEAYPEKISANIEPMPAESAPPKGPRTIPHKRTRPSPK